MTHQALASGGRPVPRKLLAALLVALLLSIGLPMRSQTMAAPGPAATAATFVTLLAKGDFTAAERLLSPTMAAAAPPATLRQIWLKFVAQFGAFERQTPGTVQAAGSAQDVTIRCVFAHDSADLVISIAPDGRIGGLHLAAVQPATTPLPEYVQPASFHERTVTVGSAPWTLPGTLTLPNGPGPFPAVVLVSGSGPEDRDTTVGALKPFRDLAWGLASHGIAVLRYDKRTLVYGKRVAAMPDFTAQEEFVPDALAAVHLLAGTPGIDPHRIFVLGHSEGAMMAPLIAQRDPRIAGLILMAGPTRSLVDVLAGQYVYLQSRGLVSAAQVAAVQAQAALVRALTPADRGRRGLLLGLPVAYWLSLRGYQPARVAQSLAIPLLIMQGARDYQVTLTDFAGWQAALARHPRVTFRLYANLFHPFVAVPPGSPAGLATPNAYNTPGHVDPAVVRDLTAWLLGRHA